MTTALQLPLLPTARPGVIPTPARACPDDGRQEHGTGARHSRARRTGFPSRHLRLRAVQVCPVDGAVTCGAHCRPHCPHAEYTPRGTWDCTHPAYQHAPGQHHCPDCAPAYAGVSPDAQARGWLRCGGPRDVCLLLSPYHPTPTQP